ncbi:hypothetical protein ACFQ4C_12040 [Larkinella insperata]|uniref:DKNYY family protein n=1 Tax=Larkinella insperata TaxID=332158 RepID=A0ABW3Q901_9BACT|nr:hypothetical protein [Larkinella insperata]
MTSYHNRPFEEIKPQGQFTKKRVHIDHQDLSDLLHDEPIDFLSEKVVLSESLVVYGIWYWEYNYKAGKWIFKGLYRNGFFDLLASRGYYKRYSSDEKMVMWIKDTNGIIEEVTIAHLMDVAKDCVAQQTDIQFEHDRDILTATAELCQEKFKAQHHLIFNASSLLNLETHRKQFFVDTPTSAYFFYQNGIVEATADQVVVHPYNLLKDRCVWKSQVIKRVFDPEADGPNSQMALFDYNTCNGSPERLNTRRTGCGYLLHRHNSPIRNQAIICNDEVITSAKEARGRTGKGLWFHAIAQVRSGCLLDGKGFNEEDRFCFQRVEAHHNFVCLDDPKPKLDFKRFFSLSTEGWVIERKNKLSLHIPPAESPKLLILSNTILDNEGTSNKARQFVIEFSNHYSKQIITGTEEPIRAEHGCVFFSDDWGPDEWACFDQYMISNCQLYLKHGLIPGDMSNVAANRLRQTAGDDFFEFVTQHDNGKGLQANTYYDSTQLFGQFRTIYQFDEKELKQRGFTERLKKYGASKGWDFQRKTGGPSGGFWYVSKAG